MKVRLIVLLAIATAILVAQEKPKDVKGWGKIKWGMTLAEARAAYSSDHVDIGTIKLGVRLSAARSEPDRYNALSKPIGEIELAAVTDKSTMGNVYDELKTPLIQKYGTPTSEDRKPYDGGTVSSATWIFPSTIIALTWSEVSSSAVGLLALTYRPVDKKASDAL